MQKGVRRLSILIFRANTFWPTIMYSWGWSHRKCKDLYSMAVKPLFIERYFTHYRNPQCSMDVAGYFCPKLKIWHIYLKFPRAKDT